MWIRGAETMEVLYSDTTYSLGTMGKNEPLNYGIVRGTSRIDVVIVRNPPTKNILNIPDPEQGLTVVVTLRTKAMILTGTVNPGPGGVIYNLYDPKVVKEIDASQVANAVIPVAKKIETGEAPITDNVVKVDGVDFMVVRYKPPTTREELDSTIVYLYLLLGGRKRIVSAAPAFVEVSTPDGQTSWCVTTLPKVLPFLWESPSDLVVAGMVDPAGFATPFLVVKNVSWREFKDYRRHLNAVRWISMIMSQSSVAGGGRELESEF